MSDNKDTNTDTSGMQQEQAEDFAAIMAKAAEPEQQAEQAQQAQAQAVASQDAAELQRQIEETAMAVEFGWSIVSGLLPAKVAERYGPEQRAAIAEKGTILAIKRGWSMGEFMAKYGAETAFVGALVGPSVPILIEWIKAPKKKPEQIEKAQQIPQQVQEPSAAKMVVAGTVLPS